MRIFVHAALIAAALAAFSLVPTSELQAQDCWECLEDWDGGLIHFWLTDSQGCDWEGCRDKPSNELEDPNFYSGGCDPYTPCWTEQEMDFAALASAVDMGAVDVLYAQLSQFSDGVLFNQERQAIQVLGCKGGVIAHLPLTADVASGLAQALER